MYEPVGYSLVNMDVKISIKKKKLKSKTILFNFFQSQLYKFSVELFYRTKKESWSLICKAQENLSSNTSGARHPKEVFPNRLLSCDIFFHLSRPSVRQRSEVTSRFAVHCQELQREVTASACLPKRLGLNSWPGLRLCLMLWIDLKHILHPGPRRSEGGREGRRRGIWHSEKRSWRGNNELHTDESYSWSFEFRMLLFYPFT